MNPFQLILTALQGLSLLTNNPALGGGSNLRLEEASELLGLLSEIVARGEEGYEELKAFADTIEAMASENRAPTPVEWSALKARSDAAHDIIQDARRRAEAEEAEDLRTEEERRSDEEAEESRQALRDERDSLTAIELEDRTDEQEARITEINEALDPEDKE